MYCSFPRTQPDSAITFMSQSTSGEIGPIALPTQLRTRKGAPVKLGLSSGELRDLRLPTKSLCNLVQAVCSRVSVLREDRST